MKTRKIITPTFAAVFTAMCLIAIQSSGLAAEEKSSAGAVAPADKNFMLAAAESGMLEVRLGGIAEKKGTRQEVKDFGAMMVSDHGKAGEELKAVAAKNGVTLPSALDAEHKAIVKRLRNLSGAAFDQAYVEEMVKAHTKDASAFETASKNAKDPDLKAFAQRTLPIIKTHLNKIKMMAESGGEKKKN
jgi:putative membrane protein